MKKHHQGLRTFRRSYIPSHGTLKEQAKDQVAAFLERGGEIQRAPSMVTKLMVCKKCGQQRTIGTRDGMRPPTCFVCKMELDPL